MKDENELLKDVSLLIEGNRITKIGPGLPETGIDEVIDARGFLAFPGMVNTHHHFYQSLTRGVPAVANAELFDWLVYLYEVWRGLDPEWVEISTKLVAGELLLTGCTLASDMFYVFPKKSPADLLDYEIETAREMGLRFHPCRGSMSRGKTKGGLPPDDVTQTEEEILNDSRRVLEKYHDTSPLAMTRIALGPCSPFSVTKELMAESVKLARSFKALSHTHLAETKDEEDYCREIYGMRPYPLMESLGWVGPDVWFAHSIFLNEEEIRLMGENRCGVAHCPTSNMRLGSGIAPIPELAASGAKVSLAVDGSASNDSSDMWGEARNAMLLARVRKGAKAMSPQQALYLATRGGAQVLGWEKELGSLEEGKGADLVLVNMNRLGFAGAPFDPVSTLLLCGDSHLVDYTIVNGEVLVKEGRLVRLEEQKLIEDANRIAKKKLQAVTG